MPRWVSAEARATALGLTPTDDAPMLLNGITGVARVPSVPVGRMRAGSLVLGDATVNDVQVTYGDFHLVDVWDLREQPAVVIGMDVLGTVERLVIDFRREEI